LAGLPSFGEQLHHFERLTFKVSIKQEMAEAGDAGPRKERPRKTAISCKGLVTAVESGRSQEEEQP
jgi:hypothetical protein